MIDKDKHEYIGLIDFPKCVWIEFWWLKLKKDLDILWAYNFD